MSQHKASTAAIKYALSCDEGMDFLSYWNEGNFDACRRMWRDVPEEVFIGADPMHPKTVFDPEPFQDRGWQWAVKCFGHTIAEDRTTRTERFLEEAIELAQACEMPRAHAIRLVDYVYGRATGRPDVEAAQALLTLNILAEAFRFNLQDSGEEELKRVWRPEVMERIQAKQASKPYNSPLPGTPDLGKIASGLGKSGKLSPLTAKAFANASRSMKEVPNLFLPVPMLEGKRPVYLVLGTYGDESSWKEVEFSVYDRFNPAYRKIEYREVKDESPKSGGE